MRTGPLFLSLGCVILLAPTPGTGQLPLKYSGPPTSVAITPGDLMTRLYLFADDSMMGRGMLTPGDVKATDYIEREVRKLGLVPAGDSGGYFQYVGLVRPALDSMSTLTVGGITFQAGTDFIPLQRGVVKQVSTAPVIFGGTRFDTTALLSFSAVRGKVVVLRDSQLPRRGPDYLTFYNSNGLKEFNQRLDSAAAVILVAGDRLPGDEVRAAVHPDERMWDWPSGEDLRTPWLKVTTRVAEAMLGAPVATALKGVPGGAASTVSTNVRFVNLPMRPFRNVVAIWPGSDPKLQGDHIVIGAHTGQYYGIKPLLPDHAAGRAFAEVMLPLGELSGSTAGRPTPEQMSRVTAILDSLRRSTVPRVDSIGNAADDNGSGVVAMLEIAEALAKGKVRPKRSILFLWHAGGEAAEHGMTQFINDMPVRFSSIVAHLELEAVGRGGSGDVTGKNADGVPLHGGEGYVQLVGARRRSTELGDLIERVNTAGQLGARFDYAMDATGNPLRSWCSASLVPLARLGVPTVQFSTGYHADRNLNTDEPQYIDYARLAQVTRLVYESALAIANLDHRLVTDKPIPARYPCVQ